MKQKIYKLSLKLFKTLKKATDLQERESWQHWYEF